MNVSKPSGPTEHPPAVLDAQAALRTLMSQLRDLLASPDSQQLDELDARLGRDSLRLLVAGEAKRGKSTLINALLGRELLPTGVLPLTAVTTTVRHDTDERTEVIYTDGRRERHPLNELAGFVTEVGNLADSRGVADVTVFVDAPLLAAGVEMVDTPGTGSIHEHNTAEALRAYTQMDAALFVVTADPPITGAERELLRQLDAQAVTVLCVLNKADLLDLTDLDSVIGFTRAAVTEARGRDVEVYPISARTALTAELTGELSDPYAAGFARFSDALRGYLDRSRRRDLHYSAAQHSWRLARRAAEECDATLAGLAMEAGDLDRRLRLLGERLASIERDRKDGESITQAEIRRLIRETSAAAADLVASQQSAIVDAVHRLLADESKASLGELERRGRDYIADATRLVVENWRADQTTRLEDDLSALESRLAQQLATHIREARAVIAELFSIELPEQPPLAGLHPTGRFRYSFAVDPGTTEMLSATLRTHLPRGLGRRRVAGYLESQAVLQLDKHAGRARADFQDQLLDHLRGLQRQLDDRYVEGAGRLALALRKAADAKSATANETAASVRDLTRRRDTLNQLADMARLLTNSLDASDPTGRWAPE
ncbi:MAG TPA: dynamin family protein [Mycobacteriales bacterium]|nr:dynamin family protein [Mycobacteriales bacterium]